MGQGIGVSPTPGVSQCTEVSPTLSWNWPRATTLSPSLGPFFERDHSFGVKRVSQNFPKPFKSCNCAWYPGRKKEICWPGKNDRVPGAGRFSELLHFALSLKKWQVALVKLDPWCELIWRQVEKRSASWYSFKYRLVFGGTGSVEGTTCWNLEKLGQY